MPPNLTMLFMLEVNYIDAEGTWRTRSKHGSEQLEFRLIASSKVGGQTLDQILCVINTKSLYQSQAKREVCRAFGRECRK